MATGYDEIPTEEIRYYRGVRQRLYEKVWPARTMLIDGKRCQVQKIDGGVWRDDPDTEEHDSNG